MTTGDLPPRKRRHSPAWRWQRLSPPLAGRGRRLGAFLLDEVALKSLSVLPLLVDSFLILRADRRCIHDHIAGTIVIDADAPPVDPRVFE